MNVTRRLATILTANVAGYYRLIGSDQEGTLPRLKTCRDKLSGRYIAKRRGHIKTTGDNVYSHWRELNSRRSLVRGVE